MLSEKEARAVKKLCTENSEGLLLAFGLFRDNGFYKASILGVYVVPFWSNREELERIQMVMPEMAEYEIIDLDVVYLVANRFQEIESQGNFVGINWDEEKNGWWGRPVTEVEEAVRAELHWPK